MKTKDRIIQASLELFNEFGERSITTNHIASHLGISPGNLYYHFRNKEDIINSIFLEYITFVESSLKPFDGPMTMEQLGRYYDEAFNSLWRFRFFYASLPGILGRDETLRGRYHQVQQYVTNRTKDIVLALRESDLIAIDDESVIDLVHLIKMVVSFWVGYKMSLSERGVVSEPEVCDGIIKLIALIKPYATQASRADFTALQERYRNRFQPE